MPSTASKPTPAPATITRKNKQTGTQVTVAGSKGAWIVRCEDHDTQIDQPSRAARDQVARTPADWCPACRKALKAAERKAGQAQAEERAAA